MFESQFWIPLLCDRSYFILIVIPPEREPHAYYNTETADYLRALLGDRVKICDSKPITLPNDSEPVLTLIPPCSLCLEWFYSSVAHA
jgi:hypothetical protein